MVHYYSRESKTHKGQFTIMEVTEKRESLVCRTPRGDIAAHLVTSLNTHNLPQSKKEPLKVAPGIYNTRSWGAVIVLTAGQSERFGQVLYSVHHWPLNKSGNNNRIVDMYEIADFFQREVLEKIG